MGKLMITGNFIQREIKCFSSLSSSENYLRIWISQNLLLAQKHEGPAQSVLFWFSMNKSKLGTCTQTICSFACSWFPKKSFRKKGLCWKVLTKRGQMPQWNMLKCWVWIFSTLPWWAVPILQSHSVLPERCFQSEKSTLWRFWSSF